MTEKLHPLRQLLVNRVQPTGGWSYSTRNRQTATEPTALAILATGLPPTELTRTQNRDGSWTPVRVDGSPCSPASWTTSLALIALMHTKPTSGAIPRAIEWLCSSRGIEGHWLWRWKFKTVDTQVRFNPDKFGWTWAPDTASWVIPTALAVLALRMAAKQHARIQLGIEMLLDRACPGGGWNAGNGVAFGVALAPHIEATAIALLALQRTDASRDRIVKDSVGWLIEQTGRCRGITSMAWAIIALHAHGLGAGVLSELLDHLVGLVMPPDRLDNATLATAALALDAASRRNIFEVAA